ncbi:hypothetical protein HPO96_26740 [Kribbella sandramycini]|uniref:Uncharacterized protein n=1 Tax=Kribbella sandramycini TaxID=60450 RepID=A0A7Y4P1M4_9ACTN|nr:hypothetical protein [Kribbella sandramycini]MBB6570707.1 hypothetical protein [Kribbella sandramycini]NOL43851.1 hypothetical protein [Kribbella sandramycini]
MSERTSVEVPLEDLLSVFGDLEEYVVSLDRILSRVSFGGDPAVLVGYVADRDVFRRVAFARRRLTELLEPVVDPEVLDRVAGEAYIYSD